MSNTNPRRREGRSGRKYHRGLSLVAALAGLAIVMLLAVTVVQTLIIRQRATRWDTWQLQSLFLADAAVGRARARLAADGNYSGETWRVMLDDGGQERPGVVEIRVQPVENQPAQRRLEIETRWPDDPIDRVRQTRQITINVPNSGADI